MKIDECRDGIRGDFAGNGTARTRWGWGDAGRWIRLTKEKGESRQKSNKTLSLLNQLFFFFACRPHDATERSDRRQGKKIQSFFPRNDRIKELRGTRNQWSLKFKSEKEKRKKSPWRTEEIGAYRVVTCIKCSLDVSKRCVCTGDWRGWEKTREREVNK